MNAIEALIYCLGWFDDRPIDNEFHSQTVYDRNGQPHWVALENSEVAAPRLCSESFTAFARNLEPYNTYPSR